MSLPATSKHCSQLVVYKLKRKLDGSIERFKSRLVTKCFNQKSIVDFAKNFSLVIKSSAIKLLLALAINFGWFIGQLDVSNAFLNSYLEEIVFLE